MSGNNFKGDGCSGGMSWAWKTLLKTTPPWEGCCDDHDKAYRNGGTSDQRAKADLDLYKCVLANSGQSWAWLMWLAVRFGGQPFMPFDWRWGFGRDYSNSWWYDRGSNV